MSKTIAAAAALALTVIIQAGAARACACCTEPGQRYEANDDVTSFLADEVRRLRFTATATVYADAGFPESVRGVSAPSEEPYKIKFEHAGGRVVLDVVDPSGKPGKISFPLPNRMARLEVDTRDGSKPSGSGPLLYKEWRLDGTASLSGVFAASGTRAKVRLILQGRGNGCPTAEDFSHWTLRATGVNIAFTLLGETTK